MTLLYQHSRNNAIVVHGEGNYSDGTTELNSKKHFNASSSSSDSY